MKAKELRTPAGDVTVAAEIPIDLKRECVNPEQMWKPAGPKFPREPRIRNNGTVVRDHALSDQTADNEDATIEKRGAVETSLALYLGK
jgi:hypothetical protein